MKNKAIENGTDINKIFEPEDKKVEILIAADKDGTINMSKDGNLKETLQYLKENNAIFVLISGRTAADAVDSFAKIGITKENGLLPKYILCDNGAGILNTKKEEIVYKKTLTPEKLDQIIAICQEEGRKEERIRITNVENIMIEQSSKSAMEYYKGKEKIIKPIQHIADKTSQKIQDATKVTVAVGDIPRQQVEVLKGRIEALGCYVDIGESTFLMDPTNPEQEGKSKKGYILDIMDQEASKGNVLKMLLEYMKPEKAMVYGNGYNDISMYDKLALCPYVPKKAICLVTNPVSQKEDINATKEIYEHLKQVQQEIKKNNRQVQEGKQEGTIIPEVTPFLIPPSKSLGNTLLKQCIHMKLVKNKSQEGNLTIQSTEKEER